jgi:hypothetical protein
MMFLYKIRFFLLMLEVRVIRAIRQHRRWR